MVWQHFRKYHHENSDCLLPSDLNLLCRAPPTLCFHTLPAATRSGTRGLQFKLVFLFANWKAANADALWGCHLYICLAVCQQVLSCHKRNWLCLLESSNTPSPPLPWSLVCCKGRPPRSAGHSDISWRMDCFKEFSSAPTSDCINACDGKIHDEAWGRKQVGSIRASFFWGITSSRL